MRAYLGEQRGEEIVFFLLVIPANLLATTISTLPPPPLPLSPHPLLLQELTDGFLHQLNLPPPLLSYLTTIGGGIDISRDERRRLRIHGSNFTSRSDDEEGKTTKLGLNSINSSVDRPASASSDWMESVWLIQRRRHGSPGRFFTTRLARWSLETSAAGGWRRRGREGGGGGGNPRLEDWQWPASRSVDGEAPRMRDAWQPYGIWLATCAPRAGARESSGDLPKLVLFLKKKEIIALFNCRMKKNEGIEKTIF